jgi:hypothetical protein
LTLSTYVDADEPPGAVVVAFAAVVPVAPAVVAAGVAPLLVATVAGDVAPFKQLRSAEPNEKGAHIKGGQYIPFPP